MLRWLKRLVLKWAASEEFVNSDDWMVEHQLVDLSGKIEMRQGQVIGASGLGLLVRSRDENSGGLCEYLVFKGMCEDQAKFLRLWKAIKGDPKIEWE